MSEYRHEWKHEINYADLLTLRMRLKAIMHIDEHTINGKYEIRSLYFDSPNDKALYDKIDGVNRREKFRIRYYNHDASFIVLEKKSNSNVLCQKISATITKEQAQSIIDGKLDWMMKAHPLCQELYFKMHTQGLRPKTIVDYTREAFVYKPGNVRITMDYAIRTGENRIDFLNPETITIPAGDSPIILEVKWDDFLPSIIKDAVTIPGRRASAFSKYEQCRIYR